MEKLKNTLGSILNAFVFLNLFIRGKILPGFAINKNDLVIDIGCGDKPFWCAFTRDSIHVQTIFIQKFYLFLTRALRLLFYERKPHSDLMKGIRYAE